MVKVVKWFDLEFAGRSLRVGELKPHMKSPPVGTPGTPLKPRELFWDKNTLKISLKAQRKILNLILI